jgi:hypothetical protein
MEYDKDGDLNFHAFYNRVVNYVPSDMQKEMANTFDFCNFYYTVYSKVMRNLAPALHKLMKRQYPVFVTENRPLVTDYINVIATTTGYKLLLNLFHLIQGQKAGVNLRQKYPEFERWVEFYARPHKPDTIDETHRHEYTWLTDKEWDELRESENQILLEYFNWSEKRKFEFIDVVQTILFKYYEELHDLNADELIIYAVHIRDEYEYYLTNCEHIELFIDCGFPEDHMKLTDEEFQTNYSNLSSEAKNATTELRNRRIAGELI